MHKVCDLYANHICIFLTSTAPSIKKDFGQPTMSLLKKDFRYPTMPLLKKDFRHPIAFDQKGLYLRICCSREEITSDKSL
jgi:hypothetical protein